MIVIIENFIAIGQGKKHLILTRLKNIGMASEKLYRITLSLATFL